MDELIGEFIAECREGLSRVDEQLVAFERDPSNRERLGEIFRVVHTIKGTCGFFGLARLERLAHAAETLLGVWRDAGSAPTAEGVSTVLASIDRIKEIVAELELSGSEPRGDDGDLIEALHRLVEQPEAPQTASPRQQAREAEVTAEDRPEAAADGKAGDEVLPGAAPVTAASGRDEHGPCAPVAAGPATGAAAGLPPRQEGQKEIESRRAARTGSLRVSVALLEALMGHVSDLVLTRNRLVRLGRDVGHPELETALQRLDQITTELRDGIMKARMQPISNAWSGVPRIVRDLSASLGKKVDLVMEGGTTELDRQLLEQIKDPLTHIVRNAIDHGLEPPEERRRAGKPETGRLKLSAAHEGGMIVVRVADDGRGLNLEKIGRKAVAAGLTTEEALARMTPRQIASFIFAPGLSTAEKVTNVSGRGVGMDVVRRNIEDIGGSVEIETWPGKGTMFTITIPLTLAIVPALIVGVGEQRFALPQQGILEIVRCTPGEDRRLEVINGRRILKLRGELLPVRSLAEILGIADGRGVDTDRGFVLVVEPAGCRFGIVVDAVHDSEEIVVEPIAAVLRNITLFAGTTLLGDGSIAIVLDLKALASAVRADDRMAIERGSAHSVAEQSELTRLLRFAAGRFRQAAVPIALVQRIERIEPHQVELVGARSVFRYGEELVPLVDVDAQFILGMDQPRPALLFSDAGRRFGLVVDEIHDVVEAEVNMTIHADGPTTLGAGLIGGSSCVLLDIGHFVNTVFGGWFGAERAAARGRARTRLLLVDDSQFFRSLLTPILENRGFDVVAVESAQLALEQLEQGQHFDVVVSDLEMPEMDGFAFAETCRARGFNVPLVALSSRCTPEDKSRTRAVGFQEHVAKLDREHLFDVVARLAARRVANS